MSALEIKLRPVEPADAQFLFELYASTRAYEMSLVPWNEAQRAAFLRMQFAAQQHDYQSRYADAQHAVIMTAGEAVGRLYVARQEQVIQILDLTIAPARRGHGIGTTLVRDLCAEAAAAHKSLRIYVESFNPSLRLFQRLGFRKIEGDEIIYLLAWRPAGANE